MRISHLVTVPETLGFLRGQVRYIRERGFDVHAISSPGEKLVAFGKNQGVNTHATEMPRRITPFRDVRALARLTLLLKRLRPTIVHTHTPKAGLLGMISAFILRTPVRVYTVHGFPFMTAVGAQRLLLQWTERISCRIAHQVLCVSPSIREVAIAEKICDPGKIKVLHSGSINGVDATGQFNPRRFSAEKREKLRASLGIGRHDLVVGFIGRIVRDKGVEELAEAWCSLRAESPNTHLILVGPEESRDAVAPLIRESLIEDPRVHLIGSVDDPAVWLSVFDLLVLPTYREGFPVVPLEAAAMELPVVATKIPGCVDAIQDGVTGTLVPPRDAEALHLAMRRYLDNPELRQRHGNAGRERVIRDFRQEVIWEAVYREYCRLLEEKGLPVPKAPIEAVA